VSWGHPSPCRPVRGANCGLVLSASCCRCRARTKCNVCGDENRHLSIQANRAEVVWDKQTTCRKQRLAMQVLPASVWLVHHTSTHTLTCACKEKDSFAVMREHDEMEPRIKVGAAMHSRSFKEEAGGGRSEIFGSVPRHHFCSNALAKWLVHEQALVSL